MKTNIFSFFDLLKGKIDKLNTKIEYSSSVEKDYNPFGGFFDRTYVWIEDDESKNL